ncbi:secretion system type I outer membrane efflux pump lipoprotein NodT [Gluconacetobacter johannae DSM 13595]|uniref:Efflux transporter outer membrane subunit n=1 Tax=Gluconacetobacter johannae TaxID=112140 RepID=A0A7W4J457_9PROT|nr:efflux transporter outer membrane subunit [Gluconacetobacter johannae]MBB2174378.1 efflux transporter outer membrane subunit [Gluconacetobacter johannae]GBQ85097.1 secretion system type I outer membrane efflux pump lipoprotein NodT [Gluconacetobacter johannae DSM 13595]
MNRWSFPRLPVATGAALLLGACTVGPDFRKPDAGAPATWSRHDAAPSSRTVDTEADPRWWTLYGDPILTALEQEVVAANLDLRIASARFAESRAERRIAGAAQFPQVAANASYARERASPNGVLGLLGTMEQEGAGQIASGKQGFGPTYLPGQVGASGFNLPQYGLNASWEVDLWGHVRRQVEAADAAMNTVADMRRDVLVALMAETARDYIELRSIQAQAAIVRQNLDIAGRSMHLSELRFREGTSTRLDVADSRAQYHSFEARLPILHDQEIHLVNALSFLTARPPGALSARLGPPRDIPPVPMAIPVGMPSDLAQRRPDIRAAEDRLHLATASVGVAVADFYPRVTLSGSLDIQALQFSGLGSWASRQYGFGPTVTLPIFEGGRLIGQLHLRKAQQKEAAIRYQRTVLNAWHEIDDAMADFTAAQRQRDRLREAVDENRIAVDIAQQQYAQGSADFLNVLTMQNMLLATQSQLVQATADISTAVARLYRALGGGWQAELPPPATRHG